MKTLVVIDLPGGLVSLHLTDLALSPAKGALYVFEGARYEVTEITEYLGCRNREGHRITGTEKLLSLLSLVYGDQLKAATAMTGMKDISASSAATESTTAGGIIIPTQQPDAEYDNVIFLRMKAARSSDKTSAVRLARSDIKPSRLEDKLELPEQDEQQP